jgi:hypothetical protein
VPEVFDPAGVLLETFRDGCINEALAAAEATLALTQAEDPAVRAALTRVAADEARHAALAWRTARWLIDTYDLSTEPLREALLAEARRVAGLRGEDPGLPRYGLLSARDRRTLARDVLLEVVGPALSALEAPAVRAAA